MKIIFNNIRIQYLQRNPKMRIFDNETIFRLNVHKD